jgi:Xaa-Pro aminopeptidase
VSEAVKERLLAAQRLAERLFDAIEEAGVLRPGITESEASRRIHDLAADAFGGPRWWHRRVVRTGPNTLHPYQEHPPDRVIEADDILFVDLGPVFDGWEADFGRTWVLGDDPHKHAVREAVTTAFRRGQERFRGDPDCTAADLYAFMRATAAELGYDFGNHHCGHLIGEFPHERIADDRITSYLHPENPTRLRGELPDGTPLTWILESHLVDRERGYGAFVESLLDDRG